MLLARWTPIWFFSFLYLATACHANLKVKTKGAAGCLGKSCEGAAEAPTKPSESPSAELRENVPAQTNLDTINLFLKDNGLTQVRYWVGSGNSKACPADSEYRAAPPAAEKLVVKTYHLSPGPVVLCLIGQDASGKWQASPTVYMWEKVPPPASFEIVAPQAATVDQEFGVTVQARAKDGKAYEFFDGRMAIYVSHEGAGSQELVFKNGRATAKVVPKTVGNIQLSLGNLGVPSMPALAEVSVSVVEGAVAGIEIEGPRRVWIGSCSRAFRIHFVDAKGRDTTVSSATPVTLSGQATGAFYSDARCTNAVSVVTAAQGSGFVEFYYKNDAAEFLTLQATTGSFTANHTHVMAWAGFVTHKVGVVSSAALTAQPISLSFQPEHSVPKDGKIEIVFPAGYNIATSVLDSYNGLSGGLSFSRSGQTIRLTRDGLGAATMTPQRIEVVFNTIATPAAAGPHSFRVSILDSNDAVLEGPLPLEPVTLAATGSISFGTYDSVDANRVHVIPWNAQVGATTAYAIRFYAGKIIGATDSLEITFPAGVDLSGVTLGEWSLFNDAAVVDGSKSMTVSGQSVTITRSGGTNVATNKNHYVLLKGIKNPSTPSSTLLATLTIYNGSSVVSVGPSLVRFTISPSGFGVMANNPWPMANGSGATNRTALTMPDLPAMRWFKSEDLSTHFEQAPRPAILAGDESLVTELKRGVLGRLNRFGERIWMQDLARKSLIERCRTSFIDNTQAHVMNCVSDDRAGISFGGSDSIYKVSKRGYHEWSTQVAIGVRYEVVPLIDSFGNILMPSSGNPGRFYSYDGLLRASTFLNTHWAQFARQVLIEDNIILTAVRDKRVLAAFFPDGKVKWSYTPSYGRPFDSPTYENGVVYQSFGRGYTAETAGFMVALNAETGAEIWATPLANAFIGARGSRRGLTANRYYLYDEDNDKVGVFDRINGTLIKTAEDIAGPQNYDFTDESLSDSKNRFMLNTSDGLVMYSENLDRLWTAKMLRGPLVPMSDGSFYASVTSTYYPTAFQGIVKMVPWILTPSRSFLGEWESNDVVSVSVASSMQAKDPATGLANTVQLVFSNGTKLPLAAGGRSSDGGSLWLGSFVVPADLAPGLHTVRVEAAQVNIVTPQATSFAEPPVGSGNSGIVREISFRKK